MGKGEREVLHPPPPHKEEMLGIKERCPMEYMPYVEEQFWRATGLRLNGLWDFTGWIKPGSYYHGLVDKQGHLYRCPHLSGTLLPRWPQLMPSESRLVSQKKPDTPVTSSGAPTMEASAPQGATADEPAPMETGGAGDGCSWAEQTEQEDDFKRCRPAKRPRSQSRRHENRHTYPFPLQDEEGRRTSTQEIYRHSGQQLPARHNVATMGITHLHLVMESGKPGALHDCGIPPCKPCLGLLEPKSGTPGGCDRVAASLG